MSNPKILTICGSLRKGSLNRMLLKEAVKAFGAADVTEADLNLPLYDGDLEEEHGIPAGVTLLAEQIAAADGIIISSPEYNKGVTGAIKNALDWISRVKGDPFADTPIVVMSANAGRTGGETGQFMLFNCLMGLGSPHILPGPRVCVANGFDEFAEDGSLPNEIYQKTIKTRMDGLRAAIS